MEQGNVLHPHGLVRTASKAPITSPGWQAAEPKQQPNVMGTVPKTSVMCREEHSWLLFGTTGLMGAQHWLPLYCTHLPCLQIGPGIAKSLPEKGSFSQSAFFHSEEPLPCTAGWWSSVRLPPPTSPWEVPGLPATSTGVWGHSLTSQQIFMPSYQCPGAKRGHWSWEKRKKTRGRKTKHGAQRN